VINPLDLTGESFLVTGASSGIGRAAAILLSRLGARLLLVARNVDRLEETRSMLEGGGHRVEPYDLSSVQGIPKWMKTVTQEFGPLSGLVHSAGNVFLRPVRYAKPGDLDSLSRIHLEAALFLAQGFRQKGVHREQSSIVLLSSIAGLGGRPGNVLYGSVKGAVIALTRGLAAEFSVDGIRVNCIVPGYVVTEMTGSSETATLTSEQVNAIRRTHLLGFGEPDDVAHSAAFLLARTGRWITGTILVVDGGATCHQVG
jgi:NAD(P)-dependent dehydrogenase (short-subunit alcohol dehydrogenase family)